MKWAIVIALIVASAAAIAGNIMGWTFGWQIDVNPLAVFRVVKGTIALVALAAVILGGLGNLADSMFGGRSSHMPPPPRDEW